MGTTGKSRKRTPVGVRLAVAGLLLGTAMLVAPAGVSAQVAAGAGPVIHHGATWLLRDSMTSGNANLTFTYGRSGDVPVMGDWDGNGTDTVGVARQTPGATPTSPNNFTWFLRNTNSGGSASIPPFTFGTVRFVAVDQLGTIPIVGDWDGNGSDTPGVVLYSPDPNGLITWQLRNSNTAGPPDITFAYSRGRDIPVVGDWNADGTDSPGVFRGNVTWLLRNTNSAGNANLSFAYGSSTLPELPVVGDWDNNGTDTPAVLRNSPATDVSGGYEKWLFRNSNSAGNATGTVTYGSDAFRIDPPIEFMERLSFK